MPRDRRVSDAVRQLGRYFQSPTDASYIDQTWSFRETFEANRATLADGKSDVADRLGALGNLTRNISYTEGTTTADLIANLTHGSMCISSFLNETDLTGYDPEQFQFYARDQGDVSKFKFKGLNKGNQINFKLNDNPTIINPNFYAMVVKNPFISPMVKDTGAVEIFMNAIPTLEFSKCVPYINIELISTLKTFGTTSPQLTMLGFLNPAALGSADKSILGASSIENVRSEATDLGRGIRSGIELFTMPQTLTNMGQTGPEYVPVIDRLRPLASLVSLSLSTKLQGGILSFTTGRMEIILHDRSRLRDIAAFVRPDLYGTTFLDITYGWSHPEGGLGSRNVFGQFLDALKSQSRYRISNSTFSFEEGGQIKVTLSIQTVGSIDLLYLGPKTSGPGLQHIKSLIELINARISEIRGRGNNPAMVQYDFLGNINDPSSLFAIANSKDFLKKVRELQTSKQSDQQIVNVLTELVGTLGKKSESAGGATKEAITANQQTYTSMINELSTFGEDEFSAPFIGDGKSPNRMQLLGMNIVTAIPPGQTEGVTGNFTTTSRGKITDPSGTYEAGGSTPSDYLSFGSVFMKMVAQPIIDSQQYDEVQVIFYPFNRYAGSVHDLPVSSFPIEKVRFENSVKELAKTVPNISGRSMIELLNNRFINFYPARAYLMTGFYETKSIEEGKAELENVTKETEINANGIKFKAVPNFSLTLEARMRAAGIPEGKLQIPRVQVAVEGCKLLDKDGDSIPKDGQSKTLLKIHVYDATMDPYNTLSEIITAAKDNELGVIQVPTAEYNKDSSSFEKLSSAMKVVKAGITLGVLEVVSKETLEVVKVGSSTQEQNDLIDSIIQGTSMVRVRGDYEQIKAIVSTGMPKITYGSSTSAITQASISTAGSAAMSTVMMQQAFNSPGETATENIQSGVPMQVLPVQLSMNTIGCPLFSPMQRMFIDFGTGTSLDSCYYVVESNSTLGQDGYKTDLKMAYSAGFPTYQSLNTQLAQLTANFSKISGVNPNIPLTSEQIEQNATQERELREKEEEELNRQKKIAEARLKKATKSSARAVKKQADGVAKEAEAAGAQAAADAVANAAGSFGAALEKLNAEADAVAAKSLQDANEIKARAEGEVAAARGVTAAPVSVGGGAAVSFE